MASEEFFQQFLRQQQEMMQTFQQGMVALAGQQQMPAANLEAYIKSNVDASRHHLRGESTNYLVSRLLQFTYVPEDGLTFENWFARHEDVITSDARNL